MQISRDVKPGVAESSWGNSTIRSIRVMGVIVYISAAFLVGGIRSTLHSGVSNMSKYQDE
jgi:hypothetical protein